MKETSILVHNACISAVQSLHYIVIHSKDTGLRKQCKEMIGILHQKEILPTMNECCLSSEGGN
jgi:hypothetical protein